MLAAGGLVGPAVFISAWVVLGRTAPGYRAVDDPISRLAATGAPGRPLMTAALVILGSGMVLYSVAGRSADRGWWWVPAAVNGVATWAVAALPLAPPAGPARPSHALAAGVAYVSLAAVPAVTAARRALARDGRVALPALTAATCAALLAASTGSRWPGLLQRGGLTVGHAWVMATAVALTRRRPG